jgi:hypothetical protein
MDPLASFSTLAGDPTIVPADDLSLLMMLT